MIPSPERLGELRDLLIREAAGLRRISSDHASRTGTDVLAKLRAKAHDWDEVAGILADVAAERGNVAHRSRKRRTKAAPDGRGIIG